jgi:hypothetical protein
MFSTDVQVFVPYCLLTVVTVEFIDYWMSICVVLRPVGDGRRYAIYLCAVFLRWRHSDYMASNCRIIGWYWIGKDLEASRRGLMDVLSLHFAGGSEENHEQDTRCLGGDSKGTSLEYKSECYHYTKLFGQYTTSVPLLSKLAQTVTHLVYSEGSQFECPDSGAFSGFIQSLPANAEVLPEHRPWSLPPITFTINCLRPYSHPTL